MNRRLRRSLVVATRPRTLRPAAVPPAHLDAWSRRAPLLRAALTGTPATAAGPDQQVSIRSLRDLCRELGGVVDVRDRSQVWLTLAVLTGRFPDRTTVVEVSRWSEFDDGSTLWRSVARFTTDESAAWDLRVATDEVLVDVAHTASTILTTGIQRVARWTTRRWLRDRLCTPVSWSQGFQSLRELTDVERQRIEEGTAEEDVAARPEATVVVPWRATYVLPELAAEPERSARLLALAELTDNRTGVIGFDCVPITSAETTQLGFAGVFAGNLAAVRSFDRIATISQAACTEYSGWRDMLSAIGLPGPRIEAVQLPVEVAAPTDEDLRAAQARFMVGRLPLVLVVGSHEPRKNHLAVLHAAELLWRDGLQFSLSFVGGNSWGGEAFTRRLADLQRMGRPVDSESRLSDGRLWAAYRLARFTVFPSLNEGFGLPVAESLAAGTPAITSDFGSMLEIATEGGALTVDPHDDHAIAEAMRRLLTDDTLHAQLTRDAADRPVRTWDDYAADAWDFLTG
ncbi:glycosyltransferase [Cellulomonas sp. KRMCY2]|uniref:glycosyltransferase n=1 Tax=Cellulomonas sp. KRMCY2 TaxID=1304865 RepID=UPI00045E7E87|nr:glycosyltransferase [Cellulomonas sp. KRMCY2]